jgi:hypothetical protein
MWGNIAAGALTGALSGALGLRRGLARTTGSAAPSDAMNVLNFDPNSISTNVKSISPYEHIGISSEIQSFINILKSRPTTKEEREYILKTVKELKDSTESTYIMAALFPETEEPARFPMVFPNPTAVFKHHEYKDVYPDNSGKIMIVCNPAFTGSSTKNPYEPFLRIYNDFRTLEGQTGQADATIGTGFDANEFTNVSINMFDDISDYYQEAVLRAAVVRVYYIGTLEKASGYFIGGINYHYSVSANDTSVNATPLTPEEVEDLYYKQFQRPEDGVRVVWFPKDYNDLNFRAVGVNPNQTSSLVIYGSGLDASQALRVDVVRHFEAFPLPKMKDYIETKKTDAINPQGTLDSLASVQSKIPQITMLTPFEAPVVADQIRPESGNFDEFVNSVPNAGGGAMRNAFAARRF